jgi:hypothetical protein
VAAAVLAAVSGVCTVGLDLTAAATAAGGGATGRCDDDVDDADHDDHCGVSDKWLMCF